MAIAEKRRFFNYREGNSGAVHLIDKAASRTENLVVRITVDKITRRPN